MSWLSQFVHDPAGFIHSSPLKAGALAIPAAIAALVGGPELFAAGAGALGTAEAGAAGAGALGLGEAAGAAGLEGLVGAEGAAGAGGGSSLAGLLGGGEGPFARIAGGEGFGAAGGGQALGYSPNFAETFSAFPGGGGGEAAPLGGASPADFAAAGGDAAGAGAAGPEAGGAGQPSFWDKIVGGASNSITKNPLGIGLAGLGLGYNMLQGSRMSPEMKAMEGQASQLNKQQAQLMSYLEKGTLPPGLKTAVDNATAAMKARIISNHARNGMNTDPSQNSALAQELNNVDMQAVSLIAQQGVALLNSGLQAAQISSNLYGMLEKLNTEHAKSTGQAIANFAMALSGGGGSRGPQGPGYFIPSGA